MPSTLNLVNSLAEYEMTLVKTSPIASIENSYMDAPLLQNIVGEMEESVEQGLLKLLDFWSYCLEPYSTFFELFFDTRIVSLSNLAYDLTSMHILGLLDDALYALASMHILGVLDDALASVHILGVLDDALSSSRMMALLNLGTHVVG